MTEDRDLTLVERRQKYIQRQIALDKGAVNVKFQGHVPEGRGAANRHGMPKLPVGQHEVKNWPVLDLGEQPEIDFKMWKLEVGGLVENPFTLNWEGFLALPQVDDTSDFHCVTTWSRYDNHWRGVRFKTIAELAIPKESAHFVLCTGYDFMPGSFIPYTTNIPLDRAIEDDVLLVHTWEGKPLPREHGGPVRMITPKLYAWKGTKWIRKIEFFAEDRKGFWEVRGYSNSAEPWFNDRYSTQPSLMETNLNKDLIRRWMAFANTGFAGDFAQFIAADFIGHAGPTKMDAAELERLERGFSAAFPDVQYSIDDLIAEDNRVALRTTTRATHRGEFQGVARTDRRVEFTGLVIYRLEDGKIAESWGEIDFLRLMRQLRTNSQ